MLADTAASFPVLLALATLSLSNMEGDFFYVSIETFYMCCSPAHTVSSLFREWPFVWPGLELSSNIFERLQGETDCCFAKQKDLIVI